ncbi:Poly(A)-specific ribonuclease PARN-like domain-containing protein 1 [Operophtera brumata]|uniref:Poly(A)-specific ribonuclease PARN-like domain-containing protein 1 n=1 Tax=Operophtera brumata TaxID=104452 RepID=A0A0L7LAH1_OPEBR|nr:Poly(A)-specific ribonuclease PARN-like domain-containing protein 1 [Operophtera brumata]
MEITLNNFSEQIPNITQDLKNACFVGFDAEFTAILSGECFKHRLFDTNEERYNKLKNEVSRMIMTQVGLTMFQYEREFDRYVATGYTFHLCPQDFGEVDQSFIFQASTLKFLCKHKFNFNKFTYEGLPYLSKVEEAGIREHLKNKTMVPAIFHGFTIEEERELQSFCSMVSAMYLDVTDPVMRYMVHHELRSRFSSLLTTDSLGATSSPMKVLEENLMNHVLGFSRIIALLEQYQKPIVGHNIFLDVILLHNQFIGPLPENYREFKRNINEMFPRIYDTKHISHHMSKKLSLNEVWKSNALQELGHWAACENSGKKRHVGPSELLAGLAAFCSQVNVIRAATLYMVTVQCYLYPAYCFIRLGHWAACENSGKKRHLGPSELLAGLAAFCSQVNVIRAATLYMVTVQCYLYPAYCFIRLGHWAACENSGTSAPPSCSRGRRPSAASLFLNKLAKSK